MQKLAENDKKADVSSESAASSYPPEVLIFLAGLNFWEGLFDNINTAFLRNLFRFRPAFFPRIIMTIILPVSMNPKQAGILAAKEHHLSEMAHKNGSAIEFVHIRGRTLLGMIGAFSEIAQKAAPFNRRFIWAHNYFNCFLGLLIRNRLQKTWLHFDMLGLAPEEELLYSESPLIFRMVRFAVLKLLGRINTARADSISVVSGRFKAYVMDRYRIKASKIQVIPCFYDPAAFFGDTGIRQKYRLKYGIADDQKLFLYSGMLQKWQMPDLLFEFFRRMQRLGGENEFRFMIATFDTGKAARYARKYHLTDLIIESVSGEDLNGIYNAADIGVATRTDDWVSRVSSPVKIPEYLVTGNSLILLQSIGDFGQDLKGRKYALVKTGPKDLLSTCRAEIDALIKPDEGDLKQIADQYGMYRYLPVIKNIFDQRLT